MVVYSFVCVCVCVCVGIFITHNLLLAQRVCILGPLLGFPESSVCSAVVFFLLFILCSSE